MDSLSKIIDYIDKCSFDELGLIHKIAGDRFHQLKYKDEIEKEEQMRRSLSVGDQVSWSSNKIPAQKETRIQGIVIRLNPKTA
ncbi:hypothetical protein KKB40_00980, partial [Patescibacteria group bacterium]|nr:hypothetical protein [Patescibacteria group bacterium]